MAGGQPAVAIALGGSLRYAYASRAPLTWYRFAEQDGYTTVEDSSGHGYDGALQGTPTQAEAPLVAEGGRSVLFGGSASQFVDLSGAGLGAIGTTFTLDAWFTPHTSFAAGDLVSDANAPRTLEALIVGGGGGGGSSAGGGGGGGGVKTPTPSAGVGAYTITVGAGGAAGVSGGNSSAFGTTATGGGRGGSDTGTGANGGSGGGGGGAPSVASATPAGGTGTGGEGNDGAAGSRTTGHAIGGGGGGASAAGSGKNGGAGTSSSISGTATTYGSGGGGGTGSADAAGTGGTGAGNGGQDAASGTAGTANRGGGGGGAGANGGTAGAGGSGVVIVRYLTGAITATGGTVTTSGSYTVHTFTTSGTFTVTATAVSVSLRLGTDGKPSMYYSGADHKTTTALTLESLVHLRVVVAAGAGTFYLDEVASGTFTSCPSLTPYALCQGLSAWVDEIAIFSTALTTDDGAAIDAAGRWTDVSDDVSGDVPLEWGYGITGNGPLDRLGAPTSARFALFNFAAGARPEGYYAPGHASVRAGFDFGRLVQITLTDSGDVARAQFTGRLATIDPQPTAAGSLTYVAAADLMADFHEAQIRDIALAQDETEDSLLRKLVRAIPVTAQPLALQIDVGLDVHPYAFDKLGAGTLVAGVIGEVMRSVLGYWSCGPDGVMRYENREARPAAVVAATFDATIGSPSAQVYAGIKAPTDLSGVYNVIRATYHPIKPGTSTEVLWSQEGTAPPIEAGQSITIRGTYFDPTEKGKAIGALSAITALVATTDYTANTAADGSGTDKTAQCSVSNVEAYASGWSATFTNSHTARVYLTKAQIRGTALRDNSPVTVEARSAQPYGERVLTFDMPFQADGVLAQQLVNYLLAQSETRASQIAAIDFAPLVHDDLLDLFATAAIGTAITVTEPVTGVTARTAYVQRVEGRYLRGVLEATFGLQVLFPFEFIGAPEPSVGFAATGGTVTTSGGYTIHTFTAGGTFQVTSGSADVDVLVVAGGGPGGGDLGGGGGAGGVKTGTVGVTVGSYTVTIGAGGTTTAGGDSSALGITAHGGGPGGDNGQAGDPGGSGGGGGADSANGGAGTSGEGSKGGRGGLEDESGGGGGGAAAAGGNGGYPGRGGNGGAGVASSISGTTKYYGGGGGGDGYAEAGGGGIGGGGDAGSAGTANTGGGGGASSSGGQAGGSGIVIIRYATP